MRRPRAVRATRYPQHDAHVLGGLRLRYVDVRGEEDGPPVVLLHGLASRIEEYDELVPHLAARRRVLALDLPGNGYSDHPDRPYTLELLEDSVLALLDALSVKEAHVAGGSLGGNLTIRLGHRAPDRFVKLAAWAPAGAWEPMPHWALLGRAMRLVRPFWPVVWVQSRFWYRRDWPGRERALAEAFAHYREVMSRGFLRMYFDLGVEQARRSLFPLAPSVRQPTLLLWGDQDRALDMGRGVRRLAELMPNARLHVFAGARHSLANEVPDALAARVGEFLSAGHARVAA